MILIIHCKDNSSIPIDCVHFTFLFLWDFYCIKSLSAVLYVLCNSKTHNLDFFVFIFTMK